jgi:hypothetical protein
MPIIVKPGCIQQSFADGEKLGALSFFKVKF